MAFADFRMHAHAPKSFTVLGSRVTALTKEAAVEIILHTVASGQKGYVCFAGMHGIMHARRDPKVREAFRNALISAPDGMPLVWLGKAKGFLGINRVCGPDVMPAVMEATRNLPVNHFLYGGDIGVAEILKAKLERRFPGVRITGTYSPPFGEVSDHERSVVIATIKESDANILWVCLGCPKQEIFMAEWMPDLSVNIALGVGAAFNYHSGRRARSPRWMMGCGLEWLFRLCSEPQRLWRRYLSIPKFIGLTLWELLAGDHKDK